MEIVDNTRTFREVDGKLEFYRNTLILKKGDVFYYAFTYVRRQLIRKIKIDELDVHPIPIDTICPPYSLDLTLAPDPLPQNCYVKGPRYIEYKPDAPVGRRPCDRLMKEIRICEILKEHPHPNIAQYMGCTVHNNRINGLVFTKYHTTLADRFEDKHRPLRPAFYLEGIESGLKHLHGLGLIHNDINPSNIMLRNDDTPVIIDFDSCQHEGDKCTSAGTKGWSLEDMRFSVAQNDYYGLRKIQEALENGRMPEDPKPW